MDHCIGGNMTSTFEQIIFINLYLKSVRFLASFHTLAFAVLHFWGPGQMAILSVWLLAVTREKGMLFTKSPLCILVYSCLIMMLLHLSSLWTKNAEGDVESYPICWSMNVVWSHTPSLPPSSTPQLSVFFFGSYGSTWLSQSYSSILVCAVIHLWS